VLHTLYAGENVKEKNVTIRIPDYIRDALKDVGLKGQTYGEVLEALLKQAGYGHVVAACKEDEGEEDEEP